MEMKKRVDGARESCIIQTNEPYTNRLGDGDSIRVIS